MGEIMVKNNWIKITDKQPEFDTFVLVYSEQKQQRKFEIMFFTEINKKGYYFTKGPNNPGKTNVYTHWMPLPEPPEIIEPL
jgi:hypothetical protein